MWSMQRHNTIGPGAGDVWDALPGQSLVALLALVGSKKMEIGELRRRTKLSQGAFGELFSRLQRECLVEAVSQMRAGGIQEEVELTGWGETLLVSMLERTCELPELW